MTTSPHLRRPADANPPAGPLPRQAAPSANADHATAPPGTRASAGRRDAASLDRGRFEFVDVLRGLAALLVALQHGSEVLGISAPSLHGRAIVLNLGETGVVLFFLVSGLVIPPSIERHRSLRDFWVKRLFRLFPAYWASLAGCLLLVAAGLFPPPFGGVAHPALAAAMNVTMLQSFFGLPSAIGVYWTLPLELLFYALCCVLFLLRLLARPALSLALGLAAMFLAELAAAAYGRSLPAGRFGLLLCALLGAVVMRWLDGRGSGRVLAALALALASVVSLGLWLRFSRFPVAHEIAAPTAGVVLLSWLLAALLFTLLVAVRARAMPRALLALGRISYSFYLWHIPVILVIAIERHRHAPSAGAISAWFSLALVLAATTLIAELGYRAVELPGIRLGARFAGERRRPPRTS